MAHRKREFDRFLAILLIIFITGFALRIYQPISTGHIVGLDGYYHMRIAEFYKQGIFYNILLYPPGTHLVISSFSMISGIGAELSTIILSSFFASLAIIPVVLLARELFDKKSGLLAALFIALSSALVTYGSRGKNLNFTLPLLLFGIWMGSKGKYIHAAALAIIIMFFSPLDSALLSLICSIFAFISSKKDSRINKPAVFLILALIAIAFGTIYDNGSFMELYITKAMPSNLETTLFFLPNAFDFFSSMSPLVIIFGAYGIFKSYKNSKTWPLLILIAVLTAIFPLNILETDRWYVYETAFLSVFAGFGMAIALKRLGKMKSGKIFQIILISMLIISGLLFSFFGLSSNNWGIVDEKRYSAFSWLSNNTETGSIILSTLDEGHWVFGIGKRIPFTTSNLIEQPSMGEYYNIIQNIYTTQNQTERINLLKEYHVSYVIISEKTYWRFGDVRSNFENPYFMMVYQDEPYEIFQFLG